MRDTRWWCLPLVMVAGCAGPQRVVYDKGEPAASCQLASTPWVPCGDVARPGTALKLGEQLQIHTSWTGTCKKDPSPWGHAGDVESCVAVDHTISAKCIGVACTVALDQLDDFVVVPKAPGNVTVEVSLTPKHGPPTTFTFGPMMVSD